MAIIALGGLAPATSAFAQPPPRLLSSDADPKLASEYLKAMVQVTAGETAAGIGALQAITGQPAFASLSALDRSDVWATLAYGYGQLRNYKGVLEATGKAAEAAAVSAAVWEQRYRAATALRDEPTRRATLAVLAERFPAYLSVIDDSELIRLATVPVQAPEDEVQRARLVRAVVAHWRPRDPTFPLDGLRLAGVQVELAAGRRAQARALAAAIGDPDLNITLRAERRYDGLGEGDGWRLPTPREAAELGLARVRDQRIEYPTRLYAARYEASKLRALNASAEALSVIDQALDRAKDPKAYDDVNEAMSWIRQERARLLSDLNRSDEAEAAMRTAAETDERGAANVSQMLNRASALVDVNPEEALRIVALVNQRSASPYGRAVAFNVSTCAYVTLKDEAKAASAFRELLAIHEKGQAGPTLAGAAVCIGDLDRVAASTIADLRDPIRRELTIRRLQVDLPRLPRPYTESEIAKTKVWRSVIARADVQAVFNEYARSIRLEARDLWRP